jgi:hypothetical protein
MAPAFGTCPTCGATLLWLDGEFDCARRHDRLAAVCSSARGSEGAQPVADTGVAAAGGSAHPNNPGTHAGR